MRQFLVIWYDRNSGVLASQFIEDVRIFMAQDSAMMKLISRDSDLWVKIVAECTMIEIREVWDGQPES